LKRPRRWFYPPPPPPQAAREQKVTIAVMKIRILFICSSIKTLRFFLQAIIGLSISSNYLATFLVCQQKFLKNVKIFKKI
jgi:hypothetical protein